MKPSTLRRASLMLVTLSCLWSGISAAADDVIDAVRGKLEERLPGIAIGEITATPIPGVFELITDGSVYYVDESAEYLFDGSLISLATRENLTDARMGTLHVGMINDIPESQMLIYEPENSIDRAITVFTDISCGYCRKLHQEIDDLLDAGIRVRYLMFPRAGLGSDAHKALESVWCADNPQQAMTDAKAGNPVDPRSCDNPIEAHVALAERVGLRGTPLIYLDNGQRVPGYREPSVLAEIIKSTDPL